jgi:hypothetical protein
MKGWVVGLGLAFIAGGLLFTTGGAACGLLVLGGIVTLYGVTRDG